MVPSTNPLKVRSWDSLKEFFNGSTLKNADHWCLLSYETEYIKVDWWTNFKSVQLLENYTCPSSVHVSDSIYAYLLVLALRETSSDPIILTQTIFSTLNWYEFSFQFYYDI